MDRVALIARLRYLVPVASLLLMALLAFAAFRPRAPRKPRPSSLAWAVCCGALAAGLCLGWVVLDLYYGRFLGIVALSAAGAAAFACCLWRDRLPFARLAGAAGLLRDALLLLAAAALARLAIELPWNGEWLSMEPYYAALELALLALPMAGLYFLAQRRGPLAALVPPAAGLIGLAQFFVLAFKADVILPRDLFAVNTALSVSGNFTYAVPEACFFGLACAALGAALLSWAGGRPHACEPVDGDGRAEAAEPPRAGGVRAVLANLAACALSLCLLGAFVAVPSWREDLHVKMGYWIDSSLSCYSSQGFLPTFVTCVQDLAVPVPEGYTDAAAEAALAELSAAFEADADEARAVAAAQEVMAEQKPSIVVVMNEAFSDLSAFEQLHAGYEGPTFVTRDLDAVVRGQLDVSVLGGGTCNTEFEFLTGISLFSTGTGKYPYSMFDLSELPSLVKQLEAQGFSTTAMHPSYGVNWNRNQAYRDLGFDRFLTIDDFWGAEWFHNGVRDRETYQRVLDLLAEGDGQQFIFDVTMQNHSGYGPGNIPPERLLAYEPSDFDDAEYNAQLNVYLSCVAMSEEDLEWFVDELRALDKPVLLAFFGDHQPTLAWYYNEYVFGDGPDAWQPDDVPELAHNQRIYHTPYFIWANYDLGLDAGEGNGQISANYLAALLCELAGVPLTARQEAQLAARAEGIPSFNANGALGADGTWYEHDAAGPYQELRDQLAFIDCLALAPLR